MAGTYYKYAERDADSQVNWAEVGKGITDMLAETNRVRQNKKDALDVAQRETMNYLAETPNGEHVGARQSILEYSDQASNQMRIMKRLMEQGQMSVKDFTIFRQNLTDNTNLAFNANKAYQEGYELTKQRERDGISSGLEPDNWSESEEFGNWGNIGWQIAPNGTVMTGKMVEEEVDGKKVRTLDKTPGGLRSMNYLNQAILGRIDKYDYEAPVDQWVDSLGKNIEMTTLLGTYGSQGLSRSLEDVTKKQYKKEGDRQIEYNFIQSENDKIKEIAGTNLDSARILYDSAKIAPNGKPYEITTNAEEAKKGDNYILKVVDPESGGFKYDLTDGQKKDTEEFIRTQMRAKYDKIEKEEVVGQLNLQETAEQRERAAAKYRPKPEDKDKESDDATSMIGKLFYGDDNQVKSAIDYFKGIKGKDGKIAFKEIVRDGNTGVTVTLANGNKENISFVDANNRPRTQEDFIAAAGPLLANELDVSSSLKRGAYQKDAKFNPNSKGVGATIERFKLEADALSDSSQRAYKKIQAELPNGFTAEDTGSYNPMSDDALNQVTITAPNGKKYIVKTDLSGEKAINAAIAVEKFVINNSPKTGGTTAAGGRTR